MVCTPFRRRLSARARCLLSLRAEDGRLAVMTDHGHPSPLLARDATRKEHFARVRSIPKRAPLTCGDSVLAVGDNRRQLQSRCQRLSHRRLLPVTFASWPRWDTSAKAGSMTDCGVVVLFRSYSNETSRHCEPRSCFPCILLRAPPPAILFSEFLHNRLEDCASNHCCIVAIFRNALLIHRNSAASRSSLFSVRFNNGALPLVNP